MLAALESNWVAPFGPDLEAFEGEIAAQSGRQRAVALSSGTAALHLALAVLGAGPSTDVLLPTLTFVAAANAVSYVGAQPVFIDSERSSWNLDPDALECELERRERDGRLPRAVIVVDLYGQCADYDRILHSCGRRDIPVVEDAAESLGATHRERPAGSFGRVATFSFAGNKIITTSTGGMLVTDDPDIADRAQYLANQARGVGRALRARGAGFQLSNEQRARCARPGTASHARRTPSPASRDQ